MSSKRMKLLAGSVATTAVMMVGNQTPVLADTGEDVRALEIESETKEVVTSRDVEKASQEVEDAQTAVNEQKNVVDSVKKEVDKASEDVESSKQAVENARKVAESVTPETIAETEKRVENLQAQGQDLARQASDQEVRVKQEEQEINETKLKRADVQKELDALEERNKPVREIEETEVEKAKIDKDEADGRVIKAEKRLEMLRQDGVISVDEAKNLMDNAVKAEETVKNQVSTLRLEKSATSTSLEVANQEVKRLQSKTFTLSLDVPDDVLSTLKTLAHTKITDKEAHARAESEFMEAVLKVDRKQLRKAITVSSNIEGVVDFTNLSQENFELFNQVFIDAVNLVRKRLDLPEARLNTAIMEVARLKAQYYNEKNETYDNQDHDAALIRRAENVVKGKTGIKTLLTNETLSMAYYEDVDHKRNMNTLLSEMIEEVSAMIFLDKHAEHGHTYILLGSDVLGIASFEEEAEPKVHHYTSVRFVTSGFRDLIAKSQQKINADIHAHDVVFPNRDVAYQEAVRKATDLQARYDRLQVDLTRAEEVLNEASLEKNRAVTQYQKALENPISEAEQDLASARAELERTTAVYEDLVAQYDMFKASKPFEGSLQDVIRNKREEVGDLTALLERLTSQLDRARQELENLVMAQEQNREDLKVAQEILDRFNKADGAVIEAENRYIEAERNLDSLRLRHGIELSTLERYLSGLKQAQERYGYVRSVYELQEAQRVVNEGEASTNGDSVVDKVEPSVVDTTIEPSETSVSGNTIKTSENPSVKNVSVKVPTGVEKASNPTGGTSKATSDRLSESSISPSASVPKLSANASKATHKILPKTGESLLWFGMLAVITALLSVFYKKKQKV